MDLIIADLHLSDNPLEEYRWGVFDWLEDLKEEHNIENIFLLGDITEKKDNHSAKLVNRVVEKINTLVYTMEALYIVRGNHDGIDPDCPFFGFLHSNPRICFYPKPIIFHPSGFLFLPHSKDPAGDWKDIIKESIKDTKIIFMHQTTFGARASNGAILEGFDSGMFADFDGLCFSGDIHLPQETGGIVYVGAPYSIYFGDEEENYGAILLDGNKWERIKYESITRRILDLDLTSDDRNKGFAKLNEKGINLGDQFKIRLQVNRSDSDQFGSWKKEIKKEIENEGGAVVSIELKLAEEKSRLIAKRKFKNTDPLTVLKRFVNAEGLDEYYLEKGQEFI